jgi:hypothetical protein
MKYFILFLFQIAFFILKAQSDDLDFPIKADKTVRSYTIYWSRAPEFQLDFFKNGKVVLKKAVLENGLEKEVTNYSEGKIASVRQNFYQDTLLVKSTIRYTNSRPKETTYYTYDSVTKDAILVKSYENGRLTYFQSTRQNGDTTETIRVFSSKIFKAKERELVYYTNNDLAENTVLFLDHWENPSYTTKKYDRDKKLVEEVYRHEEDTSITHYKYDTLGRLIQKVYKDHNIIDYKYLDQESIAIEYNAGLDQDTLIRGKDIKRFDEKGDLLYHEVLKYNKDELAALKIPIPTASQTRKYYYDKGRLRRVEEYLSNELFNSYEIQYEIREE